MESCSGCYRYLDVSYAESYGVNAARITAWHKQRLERGVCETALTDLRFYYK